MMKNRNLHSAIIFSFAMLFSFMQLHAQVAENCKVLMPSISGSYTGDCKKGIAHGKGFAQGVDHYEGQFIRGLPQGKGVYTWADGSTYTGEWQKGLREGEGVMIYADGKTEKGYWKADKYSGSEYVAPYDVARKDNLLSYNIRKVNSDGNEVIVKLFMKGQINTKTRNLNIATNNGTQYKSGLFYGIQNTYYPFELKVTYNTNNPTSRASFDVVFECTINEPGKWEVTLNN